VPRCPVRSGVRKVPSGRPAPPSCVSAKRSSRSTARCSSTERAAKIAVHPASAYMLDKINVARQ